MQLDGFAVPIIIATGYAELPPGLLAKAPRLGKPFTQRELAKAIAAVVKPARGAAGVLDFRPRRDSPA